ncbi:MAG: ATP synthase F1 subunit delta [Lachnospiraceae bacterium]|nr:ATP synthase F1 subunit delta [Lachnospiraceae bacterium]
MAKLVSKTYGDALFELALEEKKIDSLLDEVKGVLQVLEEHKDLNKLMNHPKIVKEEKAAIIENIFKGRISDELTGLMRMLVEKSHYAEMENVLNYFVDCVKEYKNIGTAYVTSAMELSKAQQKAVEKRLLETTKYVEFEMHYSTDATLIGGMVIRIGDRVVDSSIKTKLYDLTRELSKIQLKVGECAP